MQPAAQLLCWYVEMGADEAIGEYPTHRLGTAAQAPEPTHVPPPQPASPSVAPVSGSVAVAASGGARDIAAGAASLAELEQAIAG
ncbi:MAG: uracil-DNA glycosylase, partial [Alphaproteobacteria bacterium]|nr:uracil-DNA glycosylase [Alphaproteobacteria bacterium]